jgi:hypothetical protein
MIHLCKEQGDLRAQSISLSTCVATITGTDLCHEGENGFPMTIDMLPDDVLLEIFDPCRHKANFTWFSVWGQNGLVYVCHLMETTCIWSTTPS